MTAGKRLLTYSCCVRCVWSDIYDMILVYSAAPELSETRRSLLRRWMDGLCGWLAKPLFVTWGAKREGNGGIKDRSIALCPVRHSFPFLPFSCRASQPTTSGKHKQQGWLVTYCLVSCSPRLFQRHPLAVLDWIVLHCTLRRAGLCHQQVNVRQALLLGYRPIVEMIL